MTDWDVIKSIVLERDGRACARCGLTMNLSVHHIKPRSEGGPSTFTNLITLCNACHDIVELDPAELWIRRKTKYAQEVYLNANEGSFVKPIIDRYELRMHNRARRLRQKRKTKCRTFEQYLLTHPLTEHEEELFLTSKRARATIYARAYEWVINE